MKLRGFITHKAAEYYSDCADYFRICPRTKRVAVSDGVGQSVMPAEWAKLLVDAYLRDEWNPGNSTYPLMEKWIQLAWDYVNEQKKQVTTSKGALRYHLLKEIQLKKIECFKN